MNKQMIMSLIVKDFRAFKTDIITKLILFNALMLVVSFTSTSRNIFSTFILIVIPAIVWMSTLYSQKDRDGNGEILTASLPVTRNSIFVARLLTSLLLVVFAYLPIIIIQNIQAIFFTPDLTNIFSLKLTFLLTICIVFHWALFYIAFYRIKKLFFFILRNISIVVPFLLVLRHHETLEEGAYTTYFVPEEMNLYLIASVVSIALFIVMLYSTMSYFEKKDL